MSANDRAVIDFGGHLNPSAEGGGSFSHIEAREGPIHRDVEAAWERFQAGGLTGSVLSMSRYIGNDDLEDSRAANDEFLELLDPYDELYALAALPNGVGGQAAAEELERCLENGYNGGAVQTTANGHDITDEEFEPVWEVADDTGAPILLHPLVHDSLGPDVLDNYYEINSIYGREVAIARAVTTMIHDGVFDRYPDLTLVAHHSAGNIAAMTGRIRGILKDSRRGPDDPDIKSDDEFLEQLGNRLYLDSSGYEGDPRVYRLALDVFSPEQILLGTDFPYETRTTEEFQNVIAGIEEAAGDDADRILGQNPFDIMVNV